MVADQQTFVLFKIVNKIYLAFYTCTIVLLNKKAWWI